MKRKNVGEKQRQKEDWKNRIIPRTFYLFLFVFFNFFYDGRFVY